MLNNRKSLKLLMRKILSWKKLFASWYLLWVSDIEDFFSLDKRAVIILFWKIILLKLQNYINLYAHRTKLFPFHLNYGRLTFAGR
jgi:hypothetical protein